MAISMNTNTTAMSSTLVMDKAHSKLSASHQNMGKGTKQLSAADSQIIGKMAREASGLKVGQTNIKKATSMLGIAQGAFQSVNDLLTQMKEKAFAATNVANGKSERSAYQEEFSSLGQQLERVFTNTTFNGEQLLAKGGKLDGKLVFQTGTQNSTPMEADFSEQLKNLMDGINSPGTKADSSAAGTPLEKAFAAVLETTAKARQKAADFADVAKKEQEAYDLQEAKYAAAKIANPAATAPAAGAGTTSYLIPANGNVAAKLTYVEGSKVAGTPDADPKFAAGTFTAHTTPAVATVATVAQVKELARLEMLNAKNAEALLEDFMNTPGFERSGALNLSIEDNVKSQQATVALEKLALAFDEMNSNVQALMDSMQAQSEMQATVINKTEEAIGATRDTDYMEETSNIAAAKLRNVTAMAAVKQSYEITSTIINTLVNVNN